MALTVGKNYLTIGRNAGVFQTENWSEKDEGRVFSPILEDVSIRVQSYEQITYPQSCNSQFIGDASAQYVGTVCGE